MRETTFDVTMDDLRRLMSGADGTDLRVIPNTSAMRVVDVTPGSVAARCGAANDDTIETINGEPLSSVPAAYEIAAKAMRAQQIVIEGRRGDERYRTVLRLRTNA